MKLSNPFGNNTEYRITQETHGNNASNPQDLSKEKAIDANPEPFSSKVYAQADGVVDGIITSKTKPWLGGIRLKYDGLEYKKEQIHVVPIEGIVKGVHVSRGQQIGNTHETVKDKKGNVIHSQHLHDAFIGSDAPNPFDYLDRNVKVISNSTQVLATDWFKKGIFQWNKFKDLQLQMVLKKGNYQLVKAQWIKQTPDTKAKNYQKAPLGAVGTITSGVKSNGGIDWQYITFGDVAGWIPNYVLIATTKNVSNILPPAASTNTDKPSEVTASQVSDYLSKNGLVAVDKSTQDKYTKLLTKLDAIKQLVNSELN